MNADIKKALILRMARGMSHGYFKLTPPFRPHEKMPWANRDEIGEAIPPAYAEYIGKEAIKFIKEQANARK